MVGFCFRVAAVCCGVVTKGFRIGCSGRARTGEGSGDKKASELEGVDNNEVK